ncbi:MAG: hypothetical protein KAX31_03475 [Thermoplasmata archaeon]|nr:hypothetical protein [Thermoplasmata archaeon]
MSDEEKTPEAPTQEDVDKLAEEAEPQPEEEADEPCDEGPDKPAQDEEKAPE